MDEDYGSYGWACYFQEEGIEELKHSLLYNTMELENTIVCAHEELARKEEEMMHIHSLLVKTIQEKDVALAKCQTLGVENYNLQQQLLQTSPLTTSTTNEDEKKEDSPHSSNCDENFTTSPPPPLGHLPPPEIVDGTHKLVMGKTLPENGKFLQAVMEAGPLLQTLLLAGPLPQWQHPPPQLNSMEIPPVSIASTPPKPGALLDTCVSTSGGLFTKKRVLVQCEDFEAFSSAKNQKVVQQYSLTSI